MSKTQDLIVKIFGIPIEIINDNFSLINSAQWDSFKALMLFAKLEQVFNIEITLEEAAAITSIKDIKSLLIKKGVPKNEI